MTAPSTRPTRKKVGRARSAAGTDAAAASRRPRVDGDDRPRAPIRTRGLTKKYGELVAVDHLDLEVQAGEIFGLLGQNGAGKTTTILMLLGLTEPTEGQARVVGLDPARRPLEVKRRVGYLPDAVGFYADMTGRDNLRYTARLNRIPRDEAEDAIDEALEQVGLTNRADDHTEQYSRGMLQRLGIADALIKDPDVLILDEPTTAIDPLGVTEILDLIQHLARDRGMAVLLSSHLLDQVQEICDRIGIFHQGRLVGDGTVPELAIRYGFGTNRLRIVVDSASSADDDKVRALIGSIDGVQTVERGLVGTSRVETSTVDEERRRERGAVRELGLRVAGGALGGGRLAGRAAAALGRDMTEADVRRGRDREVEDADKSAATLGAVQTGWIVSIDPAREHDVARTIVQELVAANIGIEHFSRITPSLQEIYRVAVERSISRSSAVRRPEAAP